MSETSVDDFSTQWSNYTEHEGYFVSPELLDDVLAPFITLEDLRDRHVAEVGCGNGRFIKLMAPVASQVTAIEPCDGIHNARKLLSDHDNVRFVHSEIYDVPAQEPPVRDLDYIFSIGVIHHVARPLDALKVMHGCLKEGGRCGIWVYGKEGNELYLATFGRLRSLTMKMPHPALHALSTGLTPALVAYIAACRRIPALPMSDYMKRVLGRFDLETLRLTIYDQLNPKIAFYWTRDEVEQLMRDAGFKDIELNHRHGYSWTAVGTK